MAHEQQPEVWLPRPKCVGQHIELGNTEITFRAVQREWVLSDGRVVAYLEWRLVG
jgi:hypothetical protein